MKDQIIATGFIVTVIAVGFSLATAQTDVMSSAESQVAQANLAEQQAQLAAIKEYLLFVQYRNELQSVAPVDQTEKFAAMLSDASYDINALDLVYDNFVDKVALHQFLENQFTYATTALPELGEQTERVDYDFDSFGIRLADHSEENAFRLHVTNQAGQFAGIAILERSDGMPIWGRVREESVFV